MNYIILFKLNKIKMYNYNLSNVDKMTLFINTNK